MTYTICLLILCVCLLSEFRTIIYGYNFNESATITSYVKLRNNILSRDAVVHRISPLFASPANTLNTSYSMVLVDVLDIDQVKQVMTICAYLEITWRQEYLSWDPELYDNMKEVHIETKSLWAPEILVLVGYDESFTVDLPEWVTVDWTGKVTCEIKGYLSFRCAINFKKYPFDTQECKLGILLNLDHKGRLVVNHVITNSSIKADPYVTAGEWELLGYYWNVSEDLNNLSYPLYSIKVRRRPGYYVVTIIFPLVLTSAMISLVFLIPTRTGEKISFFVTLYTSLSISLNMVSTVMPRNLSSAPYLVLLFVGVLMQGLVANLATLLIVNRYEQEKDKKTSTSFQSLLRKRSDKVVPIEISGDKEPKELNSTIQCRGVEISGDKEPKELNSAIQCRGVENTGVGQTETTSSPFCLSSSQWDKAFFFLFSVAEVVFLGTLFGGTDWLSDAPPLGYSMFI